LVSSLHDTKNSETNFGENMKLRWKPSQLSQGTIWNNFHFSYYNIMLDRVFFFSDFSLFLDKNIWEILETNVSL
jgi:hypothetical protein